MSEGVIAPLEQWMESIIDYRGKTPRKTDNGIPLVTAKVIKAGKITTPNEFIDPDNYDDWMIRGIPKAGDVVITTEAPLGEIAQLPKEKVALAQRVITLRGKPNLVDNTYLKYLLLSKDFQHDLHARSTGTTVLGIKQSVLRQIELSFPSIRTQKAIAHILGTLDEKIELNQKTNETLEGIAKVLFKSWFIDFDPVRAKVEGRSTRLRDGISELFPNSFADSELGEIPRGWNVCSIGHLIDLERKSINPGNTPEEIFAHYSIPAFDERMLPIEELGQSIKSNKYIVSAGVFLVSKLNPRFPRIWLPSTSENQKRICSTEFLVCRPKYSVGIAFGYCLSKSQIVVQQMGDLASGTSNSHQRVRPADFTSLTTICPSECLLNLFNHEVLPLLEKTLLVREENIILCNLRDTLLPKLISGALRVSDAEKILEEVGL